MNLSASMSQIMSLVIQAHLPGAGTSRIDSNVFSDYCPQGLDRSVHGGALVESLGRPTSSRAYQ